MRLKITKPLSGSIDGLHIGRFRAGEIYEVGTSMANYLLAIDAAEPVSDAEPPDTFAVARHELLDGSRGRFHAEGEARAAAGGHRARRSNT